MKKILNIICMFFLAILILNCNVVKAEEKWIGECYYTLDYATKVIPTLIYPEKGIAIKFSRDNFLFSTNFGLEDGALENKDNVQHMIDSNYNLWVYISGYLGGLKVNVINNIKKHDFNKSDVLLYYDNSTILSGNKGSCPQNLYVKNDTIYLSEKDMKNDKNNERIIFNDADSGILGSDIIKSITDPSVYATYNLEASVSKIYPENDTNPPDSASDDPTISEINDCVTLLGSPKTEGTPAYYVSVAFRVVKYVAVGLLIVLSTIDFISAIMSQDKEILNKTVTKVVKRFVLCVVIFILPTILDLVLQYINDSQYLEQVKLGLCGIGE